MPNTGTIKIKEDRAKQRILVINFTQLLIW